MSLIQGFELGLWNAWILMVPTVLAILLTILLMVRKGAPGGKARARRVSRFSLLFATLSKVIFLPAAICSIFLPLQLGTTWFYVGLPIAVIGLVGTLVALVDWARTPAGEPVTRGIYRYSRHPMYVTMFLVLLGLTIASASWAFSFFTIAFGVGVTRPYFIRIEEAECLRHYGDDYRKYRNRTPRWIGIPKSEN